MNYYGTNCISCNTTIGYFGGVPDVPRCGRCEQSGETVHDDVLNDLHITASVLDKQLEVGGEG